MENTNIYQKDILIDFLKELIISIDTNNISTDHLKSVGEFLMSYKYQENEKSKDYLTNLKYLSIGYYIYEIFHKST